MLWTISKLFSILFGYGGPPPYKPVYLESPLSGKVAAQVEKITSKEEYHWQQDFLEWLVDQLAAFEMLTGVRGDILYLTRSAEKLLDKCLRKVNSGYSLASHDRVLGLNVSYGANRVRIGFDVSRLNLTLHEAFLEARMRYGDVRVNNCGGYFTIYKSAASSVRPSTITGYLWSGGNSYHAILGSGTTWKEVFHKADSFHKGPKA